MLNIIFNRLDGQTVFVNIKDTESNEIKKVDKDTIITVKYSGVNVNNKLITPEYFRIRPDVKWRELQKEFETKK